ncbi:MAG TPA: type II secretion system F family protein [Xanthobacteraceae bacterium]|jgi:tight adherence protein B|nr:type II secretion system F family protein [Xanthobacteraceae bacterium]
MSFDIDPIYLVYAFAALSAILFGEAMYLLFFSAASYRSRVNRRLSLLNDTSDRHSILVQLRRERGLTGGGDFRLPIVSLNRLVLQSGLSIGLGRIAFGAGITAAVAFGAVLFIRGSFIEAAIACVVAGFVLPLGTLIMLRNRRQKQFGAQFPDAIDIIVRSLRAGHPVPIAVTMVAREMPDPIGSEFGIVADEITYGADLEKAMRNLYFRVGQDDLPLFVTAVGIQSSTGGNLGEILENLSKVIRERFKMRRKIKALASEGRASALILSSLPIALFAVIQFVSPDFYGGVWKYDLTKIALACAAAWMLAGNLVMYRMVNFRI